MFDGPMTEMIEQKPKWRIDLERSLFQKWGYEAKESGDLVTARHYAEKVKQLDATPKAPLTKSEVAIFGEPWTPCEDEELKRYRRIGVPYREIGERLGRSRSACLGRYARLMRVDA